MPQLNFCVDSCLLIFVWRCRRRSLQHNFSQSVHSQTTHGTQSIRKTKGYWFEPFSSSKDDIPSKLTRVLIWVCPQTCSETRVTRTHKPVQSIVKLSWLLVYYTYPDLNKNLNHSIPHLFKVPLVFQTSAGLVHLYRSRACEAVS